MLDLTPPRHDSTDTGRPRRKQALLVQMVVREKL
jgi:hypothetical protein